MKIHSPQKADGLHEYQMRDVQTFIYIKYMTVNKTLNAGMFLSFWRSSHTDKNKKLFYLFSVSVVFFWVFV